MARKSTPRKDGPKPADFLTRSHIEIAVILEQILREDPPLTAYLENGEQLIVTRLRHVDAGEGSIVVDYGLSRQSNQRVLELKALVFHCECGRQHVQFSATLPRETMYDGRAAIRMEFPEFLLRYEHRHHPRFRIPLELQSKCVVECPGAISFEMVVRDISQGGVGELVHGHDLKLEPGTVLHGCLIQHPLHRPIRADLEIRHSAIVHQPDGSTRVRTGCRFIGEADEIAELARMFSVNLDASS